jgi:hypothetical protein
MLRSRTNPACRHNHEALHRRGHRSEISKACLARPFPMSIQRSMGRTDVRQLPDGRRLQAAMAKLAYHQACSPPGAGTRARFATSDDPSLYEKYTREAGWHDLGEQAIRTWLVNSTNQTPQIVSTIAAWFALSRCTTAIVAPVRSKFSDSAALVAGVPVVRCCQETIPLTLKSHSFL